MCRALEEGGRRCDGHRRSPNRQQRADKAFDDVDALPADDRVPPQRPSAEELAFLAPAHLRVMADAWDPIDVQYSEACRAAARGRPDEAPRPSPVWSAPPSTPRLYRRVMHADGSPARRRAPEQWTVVVEVHGSSRQGADERVLPDGSGILQHADGRVMAYRVAADRAGDETKIFVTARIGDAALTAVEAVGMSAYDRGRLGLPTGDAALDARSTTVSLTVEAAIAAYPEIAGLRAWVPSRGGAARFYINDWADLAGWQVHRYNTGNISSATVRGKPLSNTKARARLDGRAWIEDGCLRTQQMDEADAVALRDRIVLIAQE